MHSHTTNNNTYSYPRADSHTRHTYEVSDIFNDYSEEYLNHHKVTPYQRKVINAIRRCRSAALGYHKLTCDVCGYEQIEYNSCRNRHCPKCQGRNRLQWVSSRLRELLPFPYFHPVFTAPHLLNLLALYNKRIIYDLLFQASSYTLKIFAADPKYLGGLPGFIGILHTWGQNLCYHIHIHYIMAGAGLKPDGSGWVRLPYRDKFLFPVKAMSKVMRQKFTELLLKAYHNHLLVFDGKIADLSDESKFRQFVHKLAWENWVVYVKKPYAGPEVVLKYLGRYINRVAISNSRIIDIHDGKVRFKYKIYRDHTVTPATMTLSATEFINRFLLHVLSSGFKKIRYYGFLSNSMRRKCLGLIQEYSSQLKDNLIDIVATVKSWIYHCPCCNVGELHYCGYTWMPIFEPS